MSRILDIRIDPNMHTLFKRLENVVRHANHKQFSVDIDPLDNYSNIFFNVLELRYKTKPINSDYYSNSHPEGILITVRVNNTLGITFTNAPYHLEGNDNGNKDFYNLGTKIYNILQELVPGKSSTEPEMNITSINGNFKLLTENEIGKFKLNLDEIDEILKNKELKFYSYIDTQGTIKFRIYVKNFKVVVELKKGGSVRLFASYPKKRR